MKIKIEKQIFKKISEKRIRLPKMIRLITIGIIAIILLFSIINVNAAYNKPETTKMAYETLSYYHNGNFDYKVYLKNNTVYGGKEYLNPGEGEYFKKIIDHISASYIYSFYITKSAEISGSYSLRAEIQTNQWTKQFPLIPDKQINSKGTTLNYLEEFQIDYQYYEGIINQINQEIGLTVTNPNLVIKFYINLNINVEGKTIIQSFSQSLSIVLGSSTIDISNALSDIKKGANTKTQEIFHQEVIIERNKWMMVTYLLITILFVTIILTRNGTKKPSNEKTFKKIMKKYGEWIVETEKPMKNLTASEVVKCKTMDDLMKISEELGKPVIHIQQERNTHTFYVSENSTHYQYIISEVEETTKTVICPECTTMIQVKGTPGQSVSVICPKCINKGIAKI